MPRVADHDARRTQLTSAVRRLLARDGIDHVTVARVAREAGVSVGLVQHYFAAKDDLLLATHRETLRSVDDAVAAIVAAGEQSGRSIRDMLLDALPLYLPLDEERRADHAVRLALVVRSATGPAARRVAAEHDIRLRARLRAVVRNGMECGEVDVASDAERAAHGIVAVVSGLADELYVRGLDAEQAAILLLQDAVTRVFAHPCRRTTGG